MIPGLFLDRDGVIIEHRPEYVRTWDDVSIFPQAINALRLVKSSSFKVIIISNQSGIGRGLITPQVAENINAQLLEEIQKNGGRIDGIYICPHRPDQNCQCRKPKPGLILRAIEDLSIDPSQSILIGDNLTDLLAGQAAGLGRVALVRTGLGKEQEQLRRPDELPFFPIYDDLFHAIQDIDP
jgi:D-glycero-D-manno-heptose 1,7-bisphosphate phosphatase